MPQGDTKTSWTTWAVVWLLHLGLWFLFVAQLSIDELLAGMAAAAVATAAAAVFEALGLVKFRPLLRSLVQAWRIPWYLITGTGEIFHGLAKQLFTAGGAPSTLRAVPFVVGGHDSESTARRALAVTYTTITPNFIVLGIVSEQGLMLYHQILPGKVLPITKQLGARP